MRYFFEDYVFDTVRRELYRGSHLVPVMPLVFDLLGYLILNRERVVSKSDLVNAIWNRRIVSDSALTTRINDSRIAIGDSGEQQRLIRTLPRKGFRFVGAVREEQTLVTATVGSEAHSGEMERRSLSSPPLSLVVLPFANLSDNPQQDYFVDGVTESLTTDLSRVSGSYVIGRHTAFTYKGKAVDLKKIGRELNVRYVLEGSVQRGGDRLRVNVQLVDAETGTHLWADRFDKPVADLFDMQDEIVSRLANTLNVELLAAEARRTERSPNPDAMDLYFQGMARVHKGISSERMTQARGFFERALVLEPGNAEALVGIARVDAAIAGPFMTDDRAARLAAAEAVIIKVLSSTSQHATAHMLLGSIYISTKRSDQGIAECEQALALDRNLADAHGWIGLAKYQIGRAAETEAHIHQALRLSPRDTKVPSWAHFVGLAKLQLGVYEEAIAWSRQSVKANRNFPFSHFALAAALALLGELDQARVSAAAGMLLDPNFTVRRLRSNLSSNNPTYLSGRKRFYEGLRIAGVPDG